LKTMSELLSPQKRVLVIGGGVAGLTAALELSRMGVDTRLVENGVFPGGHGAYLACKATDRCLKCNGCLVEDLLRTLSEERPFEIKLQTEIGSIGRKNGGFRAAFKTMPPVIDPEKCTRCGVCFEKCPPESGGMVLRAPSRHLRPYYAIDPHVWLGLDPDRRKRLESLCPEGAIDQNPAEMSWAWEGDGLILATGFEPFDPGDKKAYRFERFENMITAEHLDMMLRERGRIHRVSDGRAPENVAFIQCVGSRDTALGHGFCSRICCGFALRMGLRLVHDDPGVEVTVFYMDIQNFGKDFDRYYHEAREKMRLVLGLPGDFYASEGDRIALSYYDEGAQRTVTGEFDMAVLSIGLMPGPANPFFRDNLDLVADEDGFLSLPGSADGLVLAGTIEGPLDVAESIAGAKAAAGRMAKYLSERK